MEDDEPRGRKRRRMHWIPLAYLLMVAAGCSDGGRSTRDPAPVPHATGSSRGTVAQNEESGSMIEVKADEAQGKGLPRFGFKVDPAGTPLELTKFPEPDKYLIASGPPGAPLLVLVWTSDEKEGDTAAVERAVRKHFAQPWQQPLVVGAAGSVTFGGGARPAVAFTSGQGAGRIAWCGVLVSAAGASVLVTLGRAPGQAAAMSCADVVAEPNLAAFARTFALVP
jgi:hypothetical protein